MNIQGLSKTFKRKIILDSIDWQMGTGVFGLLGPNGAGKTTLLQILSGALRPNHGDVEIDNIKLSTHPDEYRQNVGYLPQNFTVTGDWTIYQLMNTAATYKGIYSRKVRKQHIESILEKVDLWDCRNRKVKTLPIGLLRRVGVAQALLAEPSLLLLDEPSTGLNPSECASLHQLICEYGKGHTVICSSRKALDIVHCSRYVAILSSGHLVFKGSPKEVASYALNSRSSHHFSSIHTRDMKHQHNDRESLSSDFIDGYERLVGGFSK